MIFSILCSYNVDLIYDMQRKKFEKVWEKQESLKKKQVWINYCTQNVELTRQFIKSKFSTWFDL